MGSESKIWLMSRSWARSCGCFEWLPSTFWSLITFASTDLVIALLGCTFIHPLSPNALFTISKTLSMSEFRPLYLPLQPWHSWQYLGPQKYISPTCYHITPTLVGCLTHFGALLLLWLSVEHLCPFTIGAGHCLAFNCQWHVLIFFLVFFQSISWVWKCLYNQYWTLDILFDFSYSCKPLHQRLAFV